MGYVKDYIIVIRAGGYWFPEWFSSFRATEAADAHYNVTRGSQWAAIRSMK